MHLQFSNPDLVQGHIYNSVYSSNQKSENVGFSNLDRVYSNLNSRNPTEQQKKDINSTSHNTGSQNGANAVEILERRMSSATEFRFNPHSGYSLSMSLHNSQQVEMGAPVEIAQSETSGIFTKTISRNPPREEIMV